MLKRNNIRWRKNDEKELVKAVRNFNAKRTRIIKKDPSMIDFLPEKANINEIRGSIETRREYNNKVNSLKRFMKKNAADPITSKEGIKTTKYEKKEVGIKVRALNTRRAAERKKADVSTMKGTMGTIRNSNLKPKKYNLDKIKKSDWEKFVEGIDKMLKDSYDADKYERYKDNYLIAISNVMGIRGDKVYSLVQSMPADVLVQMYYDDPILQIDFVYDPLELESIIEAIEDHLTDYLENL